MVMLIDLVRALGAALVVGVIFYFTNSCLRSAIVSTSWGENDRERYVYLNVDN